LCEPVVEVGEPQKDGARPPRLLPHPLRRCCTCKCAGGGRRWKAVGGV
jgi:hypothetical protein